MRDIVINNNSQLTGQIFCSNSVAVKELINRNTNINQYGLLYGNNPIILAISKGWNHINPDSSIEPSHDKFPQMEIINKLMEYQDLDINVIDLKTGMTPLHTACLRGDSPELIIKLLEKEADPEAEDYSGKKPADLLNYKYQEVQKVIGSMTGRIFGVSVGGTNDKENQSSCATLPTRRERDENVKWIREVLHCNQSTFNKEIFNSDSRELENKINQYNAKTLRDRGRESG
ncbi:ankyrin repeat domain-containing protein [Wolbachia endosymbiont (group E) of Neria commutata]|uniref:ankyrin repeat domain-containing protein n=1 Tax=Wolbachia endosymbiont (group E) of Neria commutata TaxID=3066149 RepID=UPI0031332BA0